MKIIKQLIKALAYIHINGIVHRDIKSHNVLVDEYFNVKICDFGLAKFKSELNYGSGQFAGTPAYMAPELFQKKAYDEKIDIFSFGTLVWEILVRKVPYEGLEVSEIKLRITNDEQIFVPKTVNSELANIIHSCRTFDPLKRPSFQELLTLNFNILP
jgi:sterile alpha motif and leucine zipper-containing kinase AZK